MNLFSGKDTVSNYTRKDVLRRRLTNIQFEKLSKGKRVLDSLLQISTKAFVPLFNTYDNKTLKTHENLDFEIISRSMSGVS